MNSLTVELLHPYQSTRDLDGIRTDREVVQDIAYDGEVAYRCRARIADAYSTRNESQSALRT